MLLPILANLKYSIIVEVRKVLLYIYIFFIIVTCDIQFHYINIQNNINKITQPLKGL